MIQVHVEKISFYPPSKGYAVLLKEALGDRFLPVIVGSFEAQAIALALEEVQMPRPMTHDLFCSILEDFSMEISEIVISELSEGTFFSRISFQGAAGSREIDARPSDAIALALRVGAPIYVSEIVMDEAAVREITAEEQENMPEGSVEASVASPDASKDILKKLEEQLDQAVVEEEYEKAAEIRDKIKQINIDLSDTPGDMN